MRSALCVYRVCVRSRRVFTRVSYVHLLALHPTPLAVRHSAGGACVHNRNRTGGMQHSVVERGLSAWLWRLTSRLLLFVREQEVCLAVILPLKSRVPLCCAVIMRVRS